MSKVSIESKLPKVETSIFTLMSGLARRFDAINLSQGFPDFPIDPVLADLVSKAMRDGHNQYAPSSGWMALREEVSALVSDLYGGIYHPDTEVTITSGATEALFCAISATIGEGDEVIVFEPAYDSYVPVIEMNGGLPVFIPLEFPEFRINWENVKKRVNSRTRMIIVNSPHNPTGSTLSAQDMEELTKIVRANEIIVLSDEVYEHMVFDGKGHESVAKYPELAEQSFVISSFGKTFHTTGWKLGYCLAPEYLSKEFRKIHQFVTFSSATPYQVAIADYMRNHRPLITGLARFYQEKRDFFLRSISKSRLKPLSSKGTYFQLLDYSAITQDKDTDFAKQLVEENGLASIPVSVFFQSGIDNKVLRFCFAKENETIEKAAAVLSQL